jgi:hypothetical protein
MAQLAWPPASPRLRWRTRARHLQRDALPSHQQAVDRLWARMATDLRDSVIGFRDWEYLKNRYFSHPIYVYEVILVTHRFNSDPLGVVVMRRHTDSCELLDLIGPLDHFPVLVDQARRLTARWGLKRLYGWIARNQLDLWRATDGVEEPLDILIPTSSWTQDTRSGLLRDRWWLTAGDTDFR